MVVKYYRWGQIEGGGGSSPSSPAASGYGPPEPFIGTVAVAGTTITFSSSTKSVTVRNTHDTAQMEYSLDGGTTYQDLGPHGEKTETVSSSSILLRRVGGVVVTYEVVAVLIG